MFKVLCSTFKVENNAVIPAWFRPESRIINEFWMPACAGMTKLMN